MAKKTMKPTREQDHSHSSWISRHPFLSLVLFALTLLVIFNHQMVFNNKTLQSPDKFASRAIEPMTEEALSRGIYPQWTPYIFGGMPSYASLMRKPRVNVIDYNVKKFLEWIDPVIPDYRFTFIFLNYLLLAMCMYVLLRSQKLSFVPAIFGGLAIIFIPQFIAFTAFGHNLKFTSLALIPIILFLTQKLIQRRNLQYFILTSLAIAFQLMRSHVQVSYYTFLLLGIYVLYRLISQWKQKSELKQTLVGGVMLSGTIIISLLLTSILYLPILEYQYYSIRGGSGSGLDFNYASSWSFHPIEMITFLFPSFVGFGGETYWGKMPFTDYPLYFGIIILFFAGLSFITKRDRKTWFFAIIALFSLVVSFGRYVPILYTPMFKFLPFFDKFRVPSMIHILLDLSMVILAAYGLQGVLDFKRSDKKSKKGDSVSYRHIKRYALIFTGIIGVLALLILLGKPIYMEMAASSRSNLNVAQRMQAYDLTVVDAFKSFFLILIAVFLLFQYLQQKVTSLFLGLALSLLVVIDLWAVDFKIINPRPKSQERAYFAETPAVRFIKDDPGLYRIFPVLDKESSNWYMYHFIQSIGGYSAAKIRIYQHFLEETGYMDRFNAFISKYWRYGAQNNQQAWRPVPLPEIPRERLNFDYAVLDMLNVKYLIVNHLPLNDPRYKLVLENREQRLYENTTALPRAFFADSVTILNGRERIFNAMKTASFDPRETAIIEEAAPFSVMPSDSNQATVTHFDIHEIRIDATVKTPSVLVLSEIFYPAGWTATVDGVETKTYKTNYILRSVFLEPGSHEIVFRYHSSAFQTGFWISVITLTILLVTLVGLLVKYYKTESQHTTA